MGYFGNLKISGQQNVDRKGGYGTDKRETEGKGCRSGRTPENGWPLRRCEGRGQLQVHLVFLKAVTAARWMRGNTAVSLATRWGLWISLLTLVYSHPSENLYHEFIFGASLSGALVQSEFISGFSNSAHFRSRIPGRLFNKSLLALWQAVWSQHSEKLMLGVQPELQRSLSAVPPRVAGTLGTSLPLQGSVSFSVKWGSQLVYLGSMPNRVGI